MIVGKTCGTCSSYAEVCCDYGVCERDLRLGGVPYDEIVETAREYIFGLGGFEKFAEWGLF